ncbi:MAG: FtsQ-type POTRA domain-containing protein [Bacillota bacterium]
MSRSGAALAIIFILVLGSFGFFQSSYFRVRELEIEGINMLDAEEIRMMLAVRGDQHLYSFSLGEMKERLTADPRIETAQVSRQLPNRLVVRVTERQPVAVIIQGGVFAVVDAGGRVISVEGEWPGVPLPVISCAGAGALTLGERVDSAEVDELARCAELIGDLRHRISEIVLEEGHVILYTTEAVQVMFPLAPEDIRRAASVLVDMLDEADIDSSYTVDLRVPDRPVIRPLR